MPLARCAIVAVVLGLGACASGPDVFDEIRAMAAARSGAERLAELTNDRDPKVRAAACDGLGALGGPVGALAERLADPEPSVRYAAAFGLVRTGRADAADALRPSLEASDPNLRLLAARGLAASDRLADARALVGLAGADPEPPVRAAAAIGAGTLLARLGTEDPDATVADVEHALAAQLATEDDASVRWRIAWALSRFGSDSSDAVLGPLCDAIGPARAANTAAPTRWTRVMALRALGRRGIAIRDAIALGRADAGTLAAEEAMIRALEDADPQVVLAALRALDDARRDGEALPRPTRNAIAFGLWGGWTPHAQARATDQVARHLLFEDVGTLLTTDPGSDPPPAPPAPVRNPSPTVRGAALEAVARLGAPDAPDRVAAALDSTVWQDRSAAATATRWLPPAAAGPLLARALDDADVRVRTAAVRALPEHRKSPWLDTALDAAAAERDIAIREELGNALAALAPGRTGLAREAFADSPGDEFAEARKALLAAVVASDPDDPDLDDWLRARLGDPSLAVRKEAAVRLATRGVEVPEFDTTDAGPFPRVGAEVPTGFLRTRPVVAVETTRGTFEITLMPAAAPVHAWNFLQLAASGRYDGTVFHRVVPDFVIQGGSARGDGYDNASWLDGRLRDEISPLPFVAGTVGMPKTADPDTGGGQFFVTLVPAPHLDGRYTAFGRVTEGLSVAESIEVGDAIVRITSKTR